MFMTLKCNTAASGKPALQARGSQPEFDPQNPHGGRRELALPWGACTCTLNKGKV